MIKIELTRTQLLDFANFFRSRKPQYLKIFEINDEKQTTMKVLASNEEVESMLDELTEELTSKGMSSNNINSFGSHIEHMIDILSDKLYND